jgi:hypothetical protein
LSKGVPIHLYIIPALTFISKLTARKRKRVSGGINGVKDFHLLRVHVRIELLLLYCSCNCALHVRDFMLANIVLPA